jgi:chromosomal replication initiation ATPase DnaA
MNQIALPFDWPAEEEAGDFIVTSSNQQAVAHLDRWGSWPVKATLLVGPRKSGRSLLGRIFAAKSGAQLIDEGHKKREVDIFHAWNDAQNERVPLLIIADHAPPGWTIKLPDLRSRMAATPVISLGDPDETLCAMLLEKLLARRGIILPPDVAAFIVPRIERSHITLLRIVEILDDASLSQRRALTIPFVRDVLKMRGIIDIGVGSKGEDADGIA